MLKAIPPASWELSRLPQVVAPDWPALHVSHSVAALAGQKLWPVSVSAARSTWGSLKWSGCWGWRSAPSHWHYRTRSHAPLVGLL